MMPCNMNINSENYNINKNIVSLFLILLVLILQVITTNSASNESQILIKFRDSFENSSAIAGWDAKKKPPCTGDKSNWPGVLCDNGFVWGLKLENMGLKGEIDMDSLSELKSLRTISLMHNSFDSSLPKISKLSSLKTIYLSFNKFSGEIPSDAFKGMASLKKVHLAHNKFSGSIPSSLTSLSKLMELMLDNNLFDGQIPAFPQERFISANFSSNRLSGRIPSNLSKLNQSSFSDNEDLCGAPLSTTCPESPKLSTPAIVTILVAIFIAVAAIIAVIIILRRKRTSDDDDQEEHNTTTSTTLPTEISPKKKNNATNSSPPTAGGGGGHDLDTMERGMHVANGGGGGGESVEPYKKTHHDLGNPKSLSFLTDDIEKFDIDDLLKASAEVLSSGVFRSSYKASLTNGQIMVVKRYRKMNNVNKQEFHEHMRRLGGLNHPNLLPISAFYYKKDEKLLISRYIDNVSLTVLLHGSKSRGHMSPDWATRLKIIKGVSKGLLYLYNSLPSLIAPHGHLKSSNVVLNQTSDEPLLTDYGLLPVVNLEHAQDQMIAYKSPEFKLTGRITKKTDVWSLGILIIETLTGKFPSSFLQQGKDDTDHVGDSDLSTWIRSVVKDENDERSMMNAFDPEMKGNSSLKNSEGQMVKLLKVALRCCESDIEKRLDIMEAVEMIQEIKERDDNYNNNENNNNININSNNNNNNIGDDDFYSSYTSEGDMRSSKEDFQMNFDPKKHG